MGLINLTQHTLERIIKNIRDRIQDVTPFVGTQSEWNALSASEKAKYKIVHLLGSGTYKRDATTGDLVPIAESGGSISIGTGDSDGQIKVTPIVGTDYNVNVKGLKSAAYINADTAATASTVVQRNSSGYIYGTYINQSSAEESSATNARPCIIDGSGWHRKYGIAAFRNLIGLGNTTGALPVANGGTGATTAANARTNLGLVLQTSAIATSKYSATQTWTAPNRGIAYCSVYVNTSGADIYLYLNNVLLLQTNAWRTTWASLGSVFVNANDVIKVTISSGTITYFAVYAMKFN